MYVSADIRELPNRRWVLNRIFTLIIREPNRKFNIFIRGRTLHGTTMALTLWWRTEFKSEWIKKNNKINATATYSLRLQAPSFVNILWGQPCMNYWWHLGEGRLSTECDLCCRDSGSQGRHCKYSADNHNYFGLPLASVLYFGMFPYMNKLC